MGHRSSINVDIIDSPEINLIDLLDDWGKDSISTNMTPTLSFENQNVESCFHIQHTAVASDSRVSQIEGDHLKQEIDSNFFISSANDNFHQNEDIYFDPVEINSNSPHTISNVDLLCFQMCPLSTGRTEHKLLIDEPYYCDAPIIPVHVIDDFTPSILTDESEQIEIKTNDDGADSSSIKSNILPTCLLDIQPDEFVCAVDTRKLIPDLPNTNIDFSAENIKDLQMKDDELLSIILYLQDGILPKLQKDVRKLLLLAPDYCLNDGLLFHSRNAKSKRTQKMDSFQLVLPKRLILPVVKIYHESALAGHMGIQQTIDNLSEQFYFSKLPSIVSDFVRSCHECQERKMTKAHTKSGIIAYKTPSEPFQVWQMDLFGPLPITQSGNTYVFTATDMFTKFLFTVPIPNMDSITVSHALFQLVCNFGVCDCIISDNGSEFISQCTREICRLLAIVQNFTPSFIHHCLGLCERTHRTVAERLTPFFKKGVQWDSILQAITFSCNISANASSKYSPFEVLYGLRPKFPLAVSSLGTNFKTLSPDFHHYVNQHCDKLNLIREEVKENALKAGELMKERENKKTNPLRLNVGDFVYMLKEPTGQGRKLQPKYSGPFVVHKIDSPHIVTLRDKLTGKLFKNPVHLDRLKTAYVREPNPENFFVPKVETNEGFRQISDDTDEDQKSPNPKNGDQTNAEAESSFMQSNDQMDGTDCSSVFHKPTQHQSTQRRKRPTRKTRKPVRYKSYDSNYGDSAISESDSTFYKIKRILGQRNRQNPEYLVQFRGEPAQNAMWTPFEQLNPRTQKSVVDKPPPIVE